MKNQKLYVEVYVKDGVQIADELDEQLNNDDRCSWRRVVMISEDDTKDTYPEDKEERIRQQMNRIERMLDDDGLCVTAEIGDTLLEIANDLDSMLS